MVLLTVERIEGEVDGTYSNLFRFGNNPLLFEFRNILSRVSILKEQSKQFYFDVIYHNNLLL